MNRALKIGLYLFVALICGALGFYTHQASQQRLTTQPETDDTIDFELVDLSGKMRSSREWAGKILVVNFWATWCPPCRKEIPEFIELQKIYADKGVQFIGIAMLDEVEKVKRYSEDIHINYPVLIGGKEAIALSKQLGNTYNALPFTVIVSASGDIVKKIMGELHTADAKEIFDDLLK